MIVRGQILDKTTGAPVPGASVKIFLTSGQDTGKGTATDKTGFFEIEADPYDIITITSVGYAPVSEMLYDDFLIDWNGQVLLDRYVKDLPGVIVTNKPKNNDWAWLLLLIPLLNEKKKAVGKVEFNTGTVIAVGAGFLLLKGFSWINDLLSGLGLHETSGATEQESDPNSAWQPDYWKKHADDATIGKLAGKNAWMEGATATIYQSLTWYYDYWNYVKGVFDQIKTKCEISYFANVFYNNYSISLLTYLKNGDGITPADGLSDSHMKILIDYVKALPVK